jgi:hypothetical protein
MLSPSPGMAFQRAVKMPLAQLAHAPHFAERFSKDSQFQIGTHESHCAPLKEKANSLINILLFKKSPYFRFRFIAGAVA